MKDKLKTFWNDNKPIIVTGLFFVGAGVGYICGFNNAYNKAYSKTYRDPSILRYITGMPLDINAFGVYGAFDYIFKGHKY